MRQSLASFQPKDTQIRKVSVRFTAMFGLQSTDQRMDFCWPEKTDYNVFSRYPNFELESILMKG